MSTIATENKKVLTQYFDEVSLSGKQKKLVLVLGIALFFDFMDNGIFGLISPLVKAYWNLSMTQIGWIISGFFVGMFLGGILGGISASRLGRKKTILISIAFFSVASIATAFAPNYWFFLFARLFTGLGTAALIVTVNMYSVEMFPSKQRGKWHAAIFAAGTLGTPIIGLLNKVILPLGADSWRLLFLVGGLGIVVVILGAFWLYESPRWLILKGKKADAEAIVKTLTGHEANLDEHVPTGDLKNNIFNGIKTIFNREHIKNTLVLITIFWLAYSAYQLLIWTPTLFSRLGYSHQETATFSICLAAGLALGPIVVSQLSDLGGRKWVIVGLYVFAFVVALIYGHLYSKHWLYLFGFLFAFVIQGLNPITSTYLSELYPTKIRSIAVGFIYSIGRITIAASQLLIPPIEAKYGNVGVFYFISFVFFITIVIVAIWGEKTGKKSLERI